MTRYRAVATRTDGWWAVEVPDHPGVFTQARRLDQVPGMVADALTVWLDADVSPDQIDVEAHAGEFDDAAEEVRAAKAAAEKAREKASTAMRTAVIYGVAAGLPHRDIGVMLGISHQRVGAIARSIDKLPDVGDFAMVRKVAATPVGTTARQPRHQAKVAHG